VITRQTDDMTQPAAESRPRTLAHSDHALLHGIGPTPVCGTCAELLRHNYVIVPVNGSASSRGGALPDYLRHSPSNVECRHRRTRPRLITLSSRHESSQTISMTRSRGERSSCTVPGFMSGQRQPPRLGHGDRRRTSHRFGYLGPPWQSVTEPLARWRARRSTVHRPSHLNDCAANARDTPASYQPSGGADRSAPYPESARRVRPFKAKFTRRE
jgi:hypothetical protein